MQNSRDRSFGEGRLFTDPDPDAARSFFRRKKAQGTGDKLTTVREAVKDYIDDGDYLAVGGFGTNRIPTAVLHEIVRQGRRNLGLSGHTATHDCQILVAGDCLNRCDVAYVVGLEARGLSAAARRAFESGRIETTEWTNAALAWRYRAAAMGVSFLPIRTMLGTDTARYSAAVQITCPFTDKLYLAVPALYPDVGIIHVHAADAAGNCWIEGITVSDRDLAMASRHLIITTERIIPEDEIRRRPHRTVIPGYLVDAVIEVPYGSYPGNMPYLYYSDEDHLREWLQADRDPSTLQEFLGRHIHSVADHWEYIETVGGLKRMNRLRHLEHPHLWR